MKVFKSFLVAATLFRGVVYAQNTTTATPTTSLPLPTPTNPYSLHCPIPSTFTVSSYIGTTNLSTTPSTPLNVTFRLSYGDSDPVLASMYGDNAFHCPRLNTGTKLSYYDGEWDLLCDNNGLVRVFTDGEGNFGKYGLRRWFFCEEAPARGKYKYYTLENTAVNLTIVDSLDCTTANEIKTCTQTAPVTFPVQAYALGGTMGYSSMDEEGRAVTECASRGPGKNPMILEEEGCVWGVGSV